MLLKGLFTLFAGKKIKEVKAKTAARDAKIESQGKEIDELKALLEKSITDKNKDLVKETKLDKLEETNEKLQKQLDDLKNGANGPIPFARRRAPRRRGPVVHNGRFNPSNFGYPGPGSFNIGGGHNTGFRPSNFV